MAVLNAEPAADLPNDGLTLARAAPDFPRVAGLLTAAVRANATAFDRQCQLNGWTSITGQPFYIRGVLGRFGDAIGTFED